MSPRPLSSSALLRHLLPRPAPRLLHLPPTQPPRPITCTAFLLRFSSPLYDCVPSPLCATYRVRHHAPSSFSRLLLALAATGAAPPFLFGSPAPPPSTACTTTAPLTAYSTTAFLAYYPVGSRIATLATILCLWFPS